MTTETQLQKRSANEVRAEPDRSEHGWSERYYTPNVDILETRDEITLHADMPGVSGDDIDIRFENGELSLHGRVKPRRPEGVRYLLGEYGLGDFYRSFQISESIDAERISAEHHDGVLTLHLPKMEKAKPRKIEVKGR